MEGSNVLTPLENISSYHCLAKIFLLRRSRAQNIKIEPTTSDTPAKIDNETYPYEPTSSPLIGVPKRDLWRAS